MVTALGAGPTQKQATQKQLAQKDLVTSSQNYFSGALGQAGAAYNKRVGISTSGGGSTTALSAGQMAGQASDMMLPSGPPTAGGGVSALGGGPTLAPTAEQTDAEAQQLGDITAGRQPTTTQSLIADFQAKGDLANAANERRYTEGLDIYKNIASAYAPGGTFGRGQLEQYQRRKTKDIASQRQQLISSGLSGTTISAGLEQGYESEVGTPFRLQLADLQTQRFAAAQQAQAGFIERRTDQAPSPELMAGLVTQAESGPGGADYGAGPTGGGVTGGGGAGAPGGTAGATGAGGGGTAIPGIAGDIWSSGQTGNVTGGQYRVETRRQNKLEKASKLFDSKTKQIDKLEAQLDKLPEESKRRASMEKRISKLEETINQAETDMEKYATTTAKISSTQYAAETQRQKSEKRTIEQSKFKRDIELSVLGGRAGQYLGSQGYKTTR